MAGATEAEQGGGLLSHAQFVEGSANKRLHYEVHRPGRVERSGTMRRNQRFNEWKSVGGTEQKKTSTSPKHTRIIRSEEGEWKRVVDSTRPMKTRLHPHG